MKHFSAFTILILLFSGCFRDHYQLQHTACIQGESWVINSSFTDTLGFMKNKYQPTCGFAPNVTYYSKDTVISDSVYGDLPCEIQLALHNQSGNIKYISYKLRPMVMVDKQQQIDFALRNFGCHMHFGLDSISVERTDNRFTQRMSIHSGLIVYTASVP